MREIKNAIIESARIDIGDRGFLDCNLSLDYGGCGQGFGGYVLYLPKSWKHHELKSVAGHFIFRIMEIADVTEWSKLNGRSIRVDAEWHKIHGIGHIIKDDWFYPAMDLSGAQKP